MKPSGSVCNCYPIVTHSGPSAPQSYYGDGLHLSCRPAYSSKLRVIGVAGGSSWGSGARLDGGGWAASKGPAHLWLLVAETW